MFSIKVNGGYLDLGKAVINITMINPLFDLEKIDRTFSYPLTIENTPNNKSLLNYADRLDGPTTATIPGAELFLGGLFFESGVIRIKGSTDTKTKIVFENDTLDLWKNIESQKVTEVSLPQTVPFNFCIDYLMRAEITGVHHPTSIVRLGINGKPYWALTEQMQLIAEEINNDYPGLVAVIETVALDHIDITLKCTDPTVPLFVDTVPHMPIATIGIQHGFNLINTTTTLTTEAIVQAWQDYLTGVHDNPQTHVFPVLKNPALYNDNKDWRQYINYLSPAVSWPGNPGQNVTTLPLAWPRTLIPFPFLHTALNAIGDQLLSIGFTGDFFEDPELAQLLLYNTRTLDKVEVERLLEDNDDDNFNVFNMNFDLGDHLPEVTIKEFIEALISTFGLFIHQVDGKLHFDFIKNRLASAVQDWTSKSEPEYRQSFPDPQAYNFDFDRQGFDEELEPEQLFPIVNSPSGNDLTAGFFTCYMRREIDPQGPREWIIPVVNEQGTSLPLGQENETSRRLLFYRGLQPDSAGNLYPLASHGNKNQAGEDVGFYTLEWEGAGGLFPTWWKEYIEFLSIGRIVTKRMRLSLADILTLKTWQNPKVRIWHDKGAIEGLIKKVKFRVSAAGTSIGISDVEIHAKP